MDLEECVQVSVCFVQTSMVIEMACVLQNTKTLPYVVLDSVTDSPLPACLPGPPGSGV